MATCRERDSITNSSLQICLATKLISTTAPLTSARRMCFTFSLSAVHSLNMQRITANATNLWQAPEPSKTLNILDTKRYQ
jgi:hypothetical protein